jgi:hypothetical protein
MFSCCKNSLSRGEEQKNTCEADSLKWFLYETTYNDYGSKNGCFVNLYHLDSFQGNVPLISIDIELGQESKFKESKDSMRQIFFNYFYKGTRIPYDNIHMNNSYYMLISTLQFKNGKLDRYVTFSNVGRNILNNNSKDNTFFINYIQSHQNELNSWLYKEAKRRKLI